MNGTSFLTKTFACNGLVVVGMSERGIREQVYNVRHDTPPASRLIGLFAG